MGIHLQRDLDEVTRSLLEVAAMVEEMIAKSLQALRQRSVDLAHEVQRQDRVIDAREIEVEEECLKILALHSPVASDLRMVVTYLKVNNDLERAGDLARNLAERAESLAVAEPVEVPREIWTMAERIPKMLRAALDAVVNGDTELARSVIAEDEVVDRSHEAMYGVVRAMIEERPESAGTSIQFLSISRYLERMADLATNIAEDVVFLVDGEVVRHQAL
ncbi:MAG: phosphate signaling complex protein PhoU [Acidobacteria bacterium]|nr:phosphate signaling complex protein PhoU [Acidobacteriota bacterium]MCY3965944.1 phosphate signaling complex protein PhoU [Acidobacteriota bacterium]